MNILFLTISRFLSINDHGIYTDLMRKFKDEGHNPYIVYPSERRYKNGTELIIEDGAHLLSVRTLNIQKTNFIEKGLATLTLEAQFLRQIRKYFGHIKFDLVLYSTPPITFSNIIKYIKNRDRAVSYLLLKDIFPQNAVDLGMLKKKGMLYKYFRRKEKKLYELSDFIGCMSPANVKFVLDHNPNINSSKVEINPNSILPREMFIIETDRELIRKQYEIPLDATVFIYGGNLGKPQGIDFLIEVLISNQNKPDAFFLIVGDGTEFSIIQNAITKYHFSNVLLLKGLAKDKYDRLLLASDVGLIFLHRSFTIPNYPSRLLSYMEAKMPVLAATDKNTDIGEIMENNGYGLWAESGDVAGFNLNMEVFLQDKDRLKQMGLAGHKYLLENYQVSNSYNKIMEKL